MLVGVLFVKELNDNPLRSLISPDQLWDLSVTYIDLYPEILMLLLYDLQHKCFYNYSREHVKVINKLKVSTRPNSTIQCKTTNKNMEI